MDGPVVQFSLVLMRVATFVGVMPLFGGRNVPHTVKAGLALALTLFWFDAEALANVPASTPNLSWAPFAVATAREVVVGAGLGFAFGLFLIPARMAGSYIGQEMGLNMAAQTNPGTGETTTTFGQLFDAIGSLLFFSMNIHHIPIATMDLLFDRLPVGTSADVAFTRADFTFRAFSQTTEQALLIAAPAGICLFFTLIALILLTRAAPQFNLFSLGFSIRIVVGLIVVFLFMPETCALIGRALLTAGDRILDG